MASTLYSATRRYQTQLRLAAQLLGTLTILIWVPSTALQAVLLLGWWYLTFRPVEKVELIFFAGICVFFTAMNYVTLRQGIFEFTEQDLLLMPYFELFMWGFYLLHAIRMLDGPTPPHRPLVIWPLALLYAAAFGLITDYTALFLVTAGLLGVAFYFFHDRYDLAYAGYLTLVGAAIEYAGVHSGHWSYPEDPVGGVPLWFITLWAGVGLFLRRLVLPILGHYGYDPSKGSRTASSQASD